MLGKMEELNTKNFNTFLNFKEKKISDKFLCTIWTCTLGYCFPKDGSGVMVVCKIILGGMLTPPQQILGDDLGISCLHAGVVIPTKNW